jgi:hypothetical protein
MSGLVLVAGSGGLAVAQTGDAIARADAQFNEAKRLLSQGAIADACDRFAASYNLAPRGGTLLNLALCHEQEGKLLVARDELKAALARARRDGRADREPIAIEHLASVEARLSWLEIVPPAGPTNETIRVTIDGVPVDRNEWHAVPVEPGEHSITGSASGFRSRTMTVEIGAAEHETMRLQPLDPVVTTAIRVPPLAEVTPLSEKPKPQRFYTRPWFWGVIGAALAGGAVLAIVAARNRVEYPTSDVSSTYP